MQISHPIDIDIDFSQFMYDGTFDCIELGQSKNWILNNFPIPNDYSNSTILTSDIWSYGNIEFHFFESKLTAIYCDQVDNMTGGKHLTLDKWVLSNVSDLTLIKAQVFFNDLKLRYQIDYSDYWCRLILQSGFALYFSDSKEQRDSDDMRLNDINDTSPIAGSNHWHLTGWDFTLFLWK